MPGRKENNDSDQNIARVLERLDYFNKKYNLPLGLNENEHINIGAIEIVEKLCLAGIKYIYLSEHSCEAVVPEANETLSVLSISRLSGNDFSERP